MFKYQDYSQRPKLNSKANLDYKKDYTQKCIQLCESCIDGISISIFYDKLELFRYMSSNDLLDLTLEQEHKLYTLLNIIEHPDKKL